MYRRACWGKSCYRCHCIITTLHGWLYTPTGSLHMQLIIRSMTQVCDLSNAQVLILTRCVLVPHMPSVRQTFLARKSTACSRFCW